MPRSIRQGKAPAGPVGRLLILPDGTGIDPDDGPALIHAIMGIRAEAVAAYAARLRERVEADWLETGPWQNFDGFATHGDPYVRVQFAIDEEAK